jgi:hypothetical protein
MIDHTLEPPEPSKSDRAIAGATALVKGVAGAIPVAGSFMAEVIDLLYKQPIDKRREEWLKEVAMAVDAIGKKQAELTPQALANDEAFVTVLHQATEVALRTHQREKRKRLRHAVISSASSSAPELDRQLYFVRLIEELSVNQIIVLDFYRNPQAWFTRRGKKPRDFHSAGRDAALKEAYPEIANGQHFQHLVAGDLERRGLMSSLSGMVTGASVYAPATSTLGNQFLDFVSEPSA